MPAAPGSSLDATRGGSPLATVVDEVVATLQGLDPDALDRAATFLGDRGGRWFFTGQGRSGLVAEMAAMRFMHLGRAVHVVGEATAPSVGPADHLVALSGSGGTPVTLHLAGVALEQGADVLAVCGRAGSPLAQRAQHTLVVGAAASEQFGGSLFEQSALLVLDAVALRLGAGPDAHAGMQARHANLQ